MRPNSVPDIHMWWRQHSVCSRADGRGTHHRVSGVSPPLPEREYPPAPGTYGDVVDLPPLSESVLVSDGCLATELEARGHDLSDDLWSAQLLLDAPDEIVAVHTAFFRAGAAVATTATYQASFDGLASRGIDRPTAQTLMRRGVELARTARDAVGHGWVAASIGPYGAALANGEEYEGRYGLTVAQLRDWHRPRLEVIADAAPDLLAVETIPDVDEAEALVDLLRYVGLPAWVS